MSDSSEEMADLSEMVTLVPGGTATMWTVATITTPIGHQTKVRVEARVSVLEVQEGTVVLAIAQSAVPVGVGDAG